MNSKIGMIKDKNEKITDLFGMTHIDIYEKKEEWEVVKTLKHLSLNTSSTHALRLFIEDIIKLLEDCKILIGTTIIGMPYHILDRNGFILCEAEEFSLTLLNQVYRDYCTPKEEQINEKVEYVPDSPQTVDNDGNFFLDFIALKKSRPEVTSKKALVPFLSYELFQTVTILCDHVMPWLESFLAERGLEYSIKRENSTYLVVISHKLCIEN